MKTEIITNDIARAAELIRAGELVAVPTETVYGLAGNGLDPEVVERIYEIKGRPAVKPIALMVAGAGSMRKYCSGVPAQAQTLAKRFWPGPLSIVLKAKDIVPEVVRAGGSTVSLRCPDHELTLKALKKAKLPFAAPSANPSDEESPKNAAQVLGYFDGKIAAVIDGGECGIGRESTVIDMSGTPYRILRQGALPEADIRRALADELTVIGISGGTGCGKTTALGQLESRGALVIDCDAVYHELLEESTQMLADIERRFPGTVTDGRLDRKNLGAVVFSNAEALEALNAITHRYIGERVQQLLEDWAMRGGKLAAIDAIGLKESGLSERCKCTVAVVAERMTRMERIMKRDGISAEYAMMRINAQPPNEYFEANCDHVLRNDGSQDDFIKECKKLFREVI